MKQFFAGVVVGFLALAALAWADNRIAKQDRAAWKVRESMLQDSLAKAILDRRTDSVYVNKYVRNTSIIRDTLLLRLTDTALVREYIYQTDTLRLACLACVESAARLNVAADS